MPMPTLLGVGGGGATFFAGGCGIEAMDKWSYGGGGDFGVGAVFFVGAGGCLGGEGATFFDGGCGIEAMDK